MPRTWCDKKYRHPDKIVVDGAEPVSAPATKGGDDDDFFSSWDKPAAPKAPVTSSKPTPPPVIGRSASAGTAAPRTVSSASLRSNSTTSVASRPASKLGASRLNSSTPSVASAASSGPKKSKLVGLVAKKAAAPVNFEEAERKAAEEAERIRQLGYDREREKAEEEERARLAAEQSAAAKAKSPVTKSTPVTPAVAAPKGSAQDMERLGMGMKRLGFGGVPAAAAASTRCVLPRPSSDDDVEFHSRSARPLRSRTHQRSHARSSATRGLSPPTCTLGAARMTLLQLRRLRTGCSRSRARNPSRRINTSVGTKKKSLLWHTDRMVCLETARSPGWRLQRRTLSQEFWRTLMSRTLARASVRVR